MTKPYHEQVLSAEESEALNLIDEKCVELYEMLTAKLPPNWDAKNAKQCCNDVKMWSRWAMRKKS